MIAHSSAKSACADSALILIIVNVTFLLIGVLVRVLMMFNKKKLGHLSSSVQLDIPMQASKDGTPAPSQSGSKKNQLCQRSAQERIAALRFRLAVKP